jgi:hypothetical protein
VAALKTRLVEARLFPTILLRKAVTLGLAQSMRIARWSAPIAQEAPQLLAKTSPLAPITGCSKHLEKRPIVSKTKRSPHRSRYGFYDREVEPIALTYSKYPYVLNVMGYLLSVKSARCLEITPGAIRFTKRTLVSDILESVPREPSI